jgi:hypothetical protein
VGQHRPSMARQWMLRRRVLRDDELGFLSVVWEQASQAFAGDTGMITVCADCNLHYNDVHCSTVCPHKGIGFCVVCDCVVCCCFPNTDNNRSNSYKDVRFVCRVCGAPTDVAPDPPALAICPGCCEDHDYCYDASYGFHVCRHCNAPRPVDW